VLVHGGTQLVEQAASRLGVSRAAALSTARAAQGRMR